MNLVFNMNFDASCKQLENIILKMENGQLSLEESLQFFEEGVKLAQSCQKQLKEAEQKVQVLIEHNGELKSEPFLTEL